MTFDSEAAMHAHVQDTEYGASKPLLCFGVAVNQNSAGAYSYNIKFNVSISKNELPWTYGPRVYNLLW
jgi:hypothetical protein